MAIARLGSAASAAAATLNHTVPAGSDRMLVACFGHEFSGQTDVASVDYGGQAMVEAAQIDTPDTGLAAGVSIWYILEAGIDAASGNTITPTYSSTPADEIIHAQAYSGVDQTGGATTNPATATAESNESTPNPLIIDLTETDEGCVVAVAGCGNSSSYTWNAAMTEQTDQTDASSGSSMADRLSTTSANVDIEPTCASQNRGAACSAAFAPAAAGPSISDVDTDEEIDDKQTGVVITGAQFEASQGTGKVEISDNATYGSGNVVEQTVTAWGATSITITAVLGAMAPGTPRYVWVTNDSAERNASGFVILFHRAHAFEMVASGNIAASGENTTAQLVAPSGKTTGDFGGGRIQDDENPGDAVDLATDEYREDEWCIEAVDDAEDGEQYEFRLLLGGELPATITVTPKLTIQTATPKLLTETLNTSDTLIRRAGKPLPESVDLSDGLTKQAATIRAETMALVDALTQSVARLFVEGATMTDALVRTGGKSLTESPSVADSLSRKTGEHSAETVSFADAIEKRVATALAETLTFADVLARAQKTARLLVETISLADALGFSVGKLLTEGVSVADGVTKQAATTRSESPSFADSLTKIAGKLLAEGISFVDVLGTVFTPGTTIFPITLNETVTVVDDLAVSVGKLLVEPVGIADALANAVATLLTEGISFSDVVGTRTFVGVLLTETITVADDLGLAVGKLLAEPVGVLDDLAKVVATLLTEGISFADVVTTRKFVGVLLTETIAVADALTKKAAKLLTEGVSMSDGLTNAISTTLAESPTFSDVVTKQVARLFAEGVSLSDVVTTRKFVGVLLTESFSLSDLLARSTGKDLPEGVGIADGLVDACGKLLVEAITLVDILAAVFIGGAVFPITLNETIAFVDVVEKSSGKLLAEGLAAVDAIIRSAGKSFQESPTVSDVVIKSTSCGGSESVVFSDAVSSSAGKNLVESFAIADTVTKTAGRVLAESIVFSDVVTKFVSKLFSEPIVFVDLLTSDPPAITTPVRIQTFAIRTEMIVASAISGVRIESIPSSLLKITPKPR